MRKLIDDPLGPLAAWLVVACVAGCGESGSPDLPQAEVAVEQTIVQVGNPPTIFAPTWLKSRAQDQRARVSKSDVFCDFSFSDRLEESGIRFRNRCVDAAGKDWMPVHYDHGNGIAIADVDGDGRLDIYFTNQVGRNQLWRNLGGGRFGGITQEAGVGLPEPVSVTASFADIDNDGDADLYVTTVRKGNVLYENDGKGRFTDISRQSGLDYVGHSSGAVFFDYNRDGLLDLFLVNVGVYTTDEVKTVSIPSFEADKREYRFFQGREDAFTGQLFPERYEASILYENRGGNRFVDVSEKRRLVDVGWSGDASPLDLNGDGWFDLYVLNMQGHDDYYENVGGEYFVKKSRQLFPKTPWGAMGIKVFDFDNDGRMDIYITDMHSDMSEEVGPEEEKFKSRMQWAEEVLRSEGKSIFGNAFYRDEGEGSFAEMSDAIGAENYWPWGVSTGDLNADGFEDAFVTSSMNYPWRYGVNSLLLNNRGVQFLDSEFILGVEPRRGGRTARPWFELDCSGADEAHRDCDGQSGQIEVWGAVGTRSAVIFDLDDDGDLDIVTNDFNSEPMVLVSDLADRKEKLRYVKIELVGTESNRDGLGSRVELVVGTRIYAKVHDGQSGYLSQSLHPLYFGLDDVETVDRIEVSWPSGRKQTVAGPIKTNTLVQIIEE